MDCVVCWFAEQTADGGRWCCEQRRTAFHVWERLAAALNDCRQHGHCKLPLFAMYKVLMWN